MEKINWNYKRRIRNCKIKSLTFVEEGWLFAEIRWIWSLEAHDAMDPFTVMCLVTWPMNESKAGGDLALKQTSLLLSCKYN